MTRVRETERDRGKRENDRVPGMPNTCRSAGGARDTSDALGWPDTPHAPAVMEPWLCARMFLYGSVPHLRKRADGVRMAPPINTLMALWPPSMGMASRDSGDLGHGRARVGRQVALVARREVRERQGWRARALGSTRPAIHLQCRVAVHRRVGGGWAVWSACRMHGLVGVGATLMCVRSCVRVSGSVRKDFVSSGQPQSEKNFSAQVSVTSSSSKKSS